MAKEPRELKWLENLLPEDEYRRRPMFGGFAYYLRDKIILVTFEKPGDRHYDGRAIPYDLWNGCMFPVEREHHEKALKRFPFLVHHPVLPKWLYLPLGTENFDELVGEVVEQVARPGSYWGSTPKPKNKVAKGRKKLSKNEETFEIKMDTRHPKMFSDEPAEERLHKVKKISDLKNIGPVLEKEFQKAGIKTAQKFIELGWEKTMIRLVRSNTNNRHCVLAYALIGALSNKVWNRISEKEKQEARDLVRSLKTKK